MHISYDDAHEEIASTILKIQELEGVCNQAKNDAMNLRRKLQGRNAIIINQGQNNQGQLNRSNQMTHTRAVENTKYGIDHAKEIETVTIQIEPQQKRGRGRPRKIKETLEMISGDIGDIDVQNGLQNGQNDVRNESKMRAEYRNTVSMNVDEFTNAIYSIEDGELYVKTKNGKLYDINSMQLKGWFNPYLKTNVWIN
jgi:hypothetical protein